MGLSVLTANHRARHLSDRFRKQGPEVGLHFFKINVFVKTGMRSPEFALFDGRENELNSGRDEPRTSENDPKDAVGVKNKSRKSRIAVISSFRSFRQLPQGARIPVITDTLSFLRKHTKMIECPRLFHFSWFSASFWSAPLLQAIV
jgi:hypothetical protein